MSTYIRYPNFGVATYANFAAFPSSAADGTLAVALDTDFLYIFNATTMTWMVIATPEGNPTFPAGSVVFSNGTEFADDNANFFWDDTNNRLGLGNNTPAKTLDITGTFNVTSTATMGSTLAVTSGITAGSASPLTGGRTMLYVRTDANENLVVRGSSDYDGVNVGTVIQVRDNAGLSNVLRLDTSKLMVTYDGGATYGISSTSAGTTFLATITAPNIILPPNAVVASTSGNVRTNSTNNNKLTIYNGLAEFPVNPFVSVKEYGAKGDGVTNDSTAIQNAINTGHSVYFPSGTYLCNVVITNKTVIYGDGSTVSVLKPFSAVTATVTYRSASPFWTYHTEIRNIGFEGTALTGIGFTISQTNPNTYTLGDEYNNNVTFYNCRFYNLDKGFQAPEGNIGCQFYSCGWSTCNYGVYFLNNKFGGDLMHAGNKYFYNGEFDACNCGVYVNNTADGFGGLTFTDTIFETCNTAAYIYSSTPVVAPVSFNNCWNEANGFLLPVSTVTVDLWTGTVKTTQVLPAYAFIFDGVTQYINWNGGTFTNTYLKATDSCVFVKSAFVERTAGFAGHTNLVDDVKSQIILDDCSTSEGVGIQNRVLVTGRYRNTTLDITAGVTYSSARAVLVPNRFAKVTTDNLSATVIKFDALEATTAAITDTLVSDGILYPTANRYQHTYSPAEYTSYNNSLTTLANGYYVYSIDIKTISGNHKYYIWNRAANQLAFFQVPIDSLWHTVAGIAYAPAGSAGANVWLDVGDGDGVTASDFRLSAYQLVYFPTYEEALNYFVENIYYEVAMTGNITGSAGSVTGIVPVANGGTGSSSFTAGSVIFSNGTILTQDNANFFWNDTTNRLGLGTASPATTLDITGTFNATSTATLGSTLAVAGGITAGNATALTGGTTNLYVRTATDKNLVVRAASDFFGISGVALQSRNNAGSDQSLLIAADILRVTVDQTNFTLSLDSSALTIRGNILPFTDITYDLGSASLRWNSLHVNGTSVKFYNGANALSLQAIPTAARVVTLPDATTTLVGTDTTQTLTNKTLTGNTAVNLISGAGTLVLNTTGTITIPNATDTLVGRATTDTLTNKSISGATNTITNISLTTAVTGTLPVGNGGTGATAFTAGSVIFSNGTTLAQDNANLFWDDTNNRLGIGNAAPAKTLDVTGTFNATGVATLGSTLSVAGSTINISSGSTAALVEHGGSGLGSLNLQGDTVGNGGAISIYGNSHATRASKIFFQASEYDFTNTAGTTILVVSSAGNMTVSGNIVPTVDNTQDLGSASLRWHELHVGPTSVVWHNDATDTDKVNLVSTGVTGSKTLTLPNATDTLVGKATTDVLTNKTLSGNIATNLVSGTGTFTFNTTGAVTVPNTTATLVGDTTVQTLTNKVVSGAANTITNISLTTAVTGILPTANGGTGVNSTATFPTSGVVVTEAATETLTNKSISGATNTITNVSLTTGVTGTLPVANGGTGTTTSTGTTNVVLSGSPTIVTPTITTSITVPLVIGGTTTTSTLSLRSTSGAGTTGADIIMQTGSNGGTEAMRILNAGSVSIATAGASLGVGAAATPGGTTALYVRTATDKNLVVRAASDFGAFTGATIQTRTDAGADRSLMLSADTLRVTVDGGTVMALTVDSTGNAILGTVGAGLRIKEGSNAKMGTSVLVAGTVTVSNTSVTASSRIFLTSQVDGGVPGFVRVSARTAATSFVITSSNVADTSTIAWMLVEPS